MSSSETSRDVDNTIEQSFPASDPPSWGGTTASPSAGPTTVRVPPAVTGTGSASLLVLRLTLAAVFFPHGAQKALGAFGGPGFSGTLDMFQKAFGVPPVLTVLVIAAEFLGSIALAFGFLTRFTALALAAVMAGAIYLAHAPHGFFMNWSGAKAGEGFEFHILAIGIALALVFSGAGRWSLDACVLRRFQARRRS